MAEVNIWEVRQNGDRDAIKNASSEEIAAAVVSLCDRCEALRAIDFDRLMSIGIWLASGGHESADEIVIRWLANKTTAHRLDIAAALLTGLWLRSTRKSAVPATLVDKLADLKASVPTLTSSPEAEYGYAGAMSQILRDERATGAEIETAARAIEAVMATGTGDPILDNQLASHAPLEIARARARVVR
jgi:hypothetical protein